MESAESYQEIAIGVESNLFRAVPGEEVAMFLSNHRAHDALKQNRLYEMLSCDPDYIDAYGLEVVAGRVFPRNMGTM